MKNTPEKHPDEWIAAYHDGELRGDLLAQVQAHLAGCPQCQTKLEDLRALSSLLRADPAPEPLRAPQRFAADLMLQLPREQPHPWRRRALRIAWASAPAVLLAGWAFIQAVVLVTGLCLFLFADLLPGQPASMTLMNLLSLGDWAGVLFPAVQIILIEAALTLLLLALMGGWLASWWAVQKNKGAKSWTTSEF